jgi:hypothetical protein
MQVDDHSLHDNNEPCHGSVGVVMAHPVLWLSVCPLILPHFSNP